LKSERFHNTPLRYSTDPETFCIQRESGYIRKDLKESGSFMRPTSGYQVQGSNVSHEGRRSVHGVSDYNPGSQTRSVHGGSDYHPGSQMRSVHGGSDYNPGSQMRSGNGYHSGQGSNFGGSRHVQKSNYHNRY